MIKFKIIAPKAKRYTEKEREMIFAIYSLRKKAAEMYKFHKGPAQRIQELRRQYLKSDYFTYKIHNEKYQVNVEYIATDDKRNILTVYRQRIREKRNELLLIDEDHSQTGCGAITKIHTTHRGVLNYYLQKQLITPKRPSTEERHIGIEIECCIPKDADLALLIPYVKILSMSDDGSIGELTKGYMSKEFKVLTTTKNYLQDVKSICDVLLKMKATVNKTCGLHVHLDTRQLKEDGKIVENFVNLVKSQKYLQGMVDVTRRENQYCKPTRSLNPFTQTSRYHAINGQALRKFNTIEVRLHHGSIDSIEISNWITLLLDIVNAEPIKRAPATLKVWMEKIHATPELKKYVEEKIKLNPPVNETPIVPCPMRHDDEICNSCSENWFNHRGHTCHTGREGIFPGCEISVESEETANV